jgi:multiple sugar transport system substrate-binding protein
MRKMKGFTNVSSALSVLLLTFSLAACSSNTAPASTSAAKDTPTATQQSTPAATSTTNASTSTEKKVIKIAYQKFGTPPIWSEEWLKKVKEQFESQNAGVTAELVPIQASENDFYTKLDLMMKSADTSPDVVTEDTFLINSDAAAGFLEPLNDRVANWSDWNNFVEAMKKGGSSNDGKIYGIPYSTDTRGLWYNTNIFKKAGLPVPWEPKSWDDVMTAIKTVKQKAPDVVPFWGYVGKATGEATTMQLFEMLLYGTDDTLYNPSTDKWIVKSPGFKDSLQFVHDVFTKGLGPQMSQILNAQAGNTENTQLMPKEKIAIALDGNWIPSAWIENGSAPWPDALKVYQLAAMPTQKGQSPGYTSMSGGWALSVSSKSKQKDLAWQFIQMATNKENNKWLNMKQGNLSPRNDVAQDPEYMNTPGQAFAQATNFTKFTHFRPANTQYPAVSTQIQTIVESVATGALTPEAAMDQYAKSVERIVGKDKIEEKK